MNLCTGIVDILDKGSFRWRSQAGRKEEEHRKDPCSVLKVGVTEENATDRVRWRQMIPYCDH